LVVAAVPMISFFASATVTVGAVQKAVGKMTLGGVTVRKANHDVIIA
jgi:hypothetical protein